jgi:hypothetical protein
MKSAVVASAVLLAALSPSSVRAQSRVSIELGGMVSAYNVESAPGVAAGAIRVPDSAGTGSNGATGGHNPGSGIAAFEIRPTVTLDSGFLFGIGFRAGQAGISNAGGGSSLVGSDVAIGYQHRFGRFLPFVKAMFGLNSYDYANGSSGHQTDWRLDAVIGSRLYVSNKLYLSASAFAGWGDRYGGSVAVGGDVVQFFRRGALP